MDGSLDFNFAQQHSAMAAEAESQFAAPAPPVPTTLSGGGAPRTPYSATPSWVHWNLSRNTRTSYLLTRGCYRPKRSFPIVNKNWREFYLSSTFFVTSAL